MTSPHPAAPAEPTEPAGDRGQATVELALVLPLVTLLLFALVHVGVLARDQILTTHAAREAARAAAVDADPGAATRAARRAGPLAADRLEVTVDGRGGVGSRLTATVRYRAPVRVPLVSRLVGEVTFEATASMRVER